MEGSSQGLTKGSWTVKEDSLLRQCIDKYGEGKWHQVPVRAGLNRCRNSCRLRWLNYLKPSIKKGKFSIDEVDLLLRMHKLLGNRWSLIAGRLPGRTGNDVKNYWNTNLGKKQETCCKSKMRKREITCSTTIPAQKLNVIRPRPRSFSSSNDLIEVGVGEVSTKVGSIASDKDETCEFVNNVMDEESLWWESLLEESQEEDAMGPVATSPDKSNNFLINSMSSTFDVDQLLNLFNADSEEVD